MCDSQTLVPHYEYNKLLLKLSRHLSETELQEIKFLLRECIPDGKREKIPHLLDLFKRLEELTLLGPDEVSILKSLFELMEKPELFAMVSEYMERNKMNKVV